MLSKEILDELDKIFENLPAEAVAAKTTDLIKVITVQKISDEKRKGVRAVLTKEEKNKIKQRVIREDRKRYLMIIKGAEEIIKDMEKEIAELQKVCKHPNAERALEPIYGGHKCPDCGWPQNEHRTTSISYELGY